jgi:hypothetical protein
MCFQSIMVDEDDAISPHRHPPGRRKDAEVDRRGPEEENDEGGSGQRDRLPGRQKCSHGTTLNDPEGVSF